jgi:uncharacterized protein YbjT (DUF2867 family)
MRVLIAGASGAIGRALVRRLRANQHEVFALTQSRDSGAVLKEIGAELWHRLLRPPGGDGVRVWQITSGSRRAIWEATRPQRGDIPANIAVGLDRTRSGHVRRGLGRGVSRDRPREAGDPAELSILCGLAVGYPDPDFAANELHVGREAIEKNVMFLDS